MAGGPGSGRPWGPLALSNVLTMRLGVELISPFFTPSLPRRAPNPNIGAVPLISHLSAHHFVCVQRRCLSYYIVLPLLCLSSLSACATEVGNWASPLHLLALRVSSYAHNAQTDNKGPGLNMSLAGQQVVKSEPQKRLRFKTTSHKIYFTIYLGFYSPLICVIIFALPGTTSFATSCQLLANSEIHNESIQMVIFLLSLHNSKCF